MLNSSVPPVKFTLNAEGEWGTASVNFSVASFAMEMAPVLWNTGVVVLFVPRIFSVPPEIVVVPPMVTFPDNVCYAVPSFTKFPVVVIVFANEVSAVFVNVTSSVSSIASFASLKSV